MPDVEEIRFDDDSEDSSEDSEDMENLISSKKSSKKDNFISMGLDALEPVDFKVMIILFLLFMFVMSDIFVVNVLGMFSGSVEGEDVTLKGDCIRGLFLVLLVIVATMLCAHGIL